MTKKKSCKKGYYYCNTDEKCKKIPKGYHLMPTGYLMKDSDHKEDEKSDDTEGKKKNGNGNGSNGNGNGNGGSDGGSNGGGVSEAWSAKYKKSIDCDNPKGFSQKAHCRGRKIDEGKDGMSDHEVSMAKGQVRNSITNLKRVEKVLKTMTDKDDLPAWLQAKITDTEHNTDAAAGYMDEEVITEKRDGKSSKDKGYSLRDWFRGGGWKQTGGKYDGKPCAKQPGQKTKPYCRDADDRAAMSKKERNKRAAKKRREDPNPNKKGKAKNVRQESFSNWRQDLQEKPGDGYLGPTPIPNPIRLAQDAVDATNRASAKKVERINKILPGSASMPKHTYFNKGPSAASQRYLGLQNSYQPEGEVVTERDAWGTGPMDRIKCADGVCRTPAEIEKLRLEKLKGKVVDKAHYEPEGELVDEGKKDACYHKVKSRYSVWPSAYASGALVKCRKVGAKNWGNKSKKKNESYDLSNWRDDFQATEYESVDIIKAEPLQPTQGLGSDMLEAKSKKDRLKEISAQLKKASAMHAKQSKAVAKCADELSEAPIVMPGSRISPQSPVGMARSMGGRRAMRAPGGMYSGRPAPVTPVPKPQSAAVTPVTPAKPVTPQPAAATPVTPVKPVTPQPAAATPVTPVKPVTPQPAAATPVTPVKPVQSDASRALNTGSLEDKQDAMDIVNNNYASSIDQLATDMMIRNIKKPTSNPGQAASFTPAAGNNTGSSLNADQRSARDARIQSAINNIADPAARQRAQKRLEDRQARRNLPSGTYQGLLNPNQSRTIGGRTFAPGEKLDPEAEAELRRISQLAIQQQKKNNPNFKLGDDYQPEGEVLDEKCWKGYEKKGMKTMFGKRYPNCVKKKKTRKEEFEVSEGKYTRGEIYKKGTAPHRDPVAGESYPKETYKKKVPIADEVQLGEKKDPCWDTHKQVGMKKKGNRMVPNCVPKEQVSDWRSELDLQEKKKKNCGCGKDPCETYGKQDVKEDWQKANRKDKTDGMSQKAVNAYKRENPGSKLKTAVTGKVKKGSKDAKRRKSFCSRSNGQRKMHNIDCSKTPDKKICKARRRWKC